MASRRRLTVARISRRTIVAAAPALAVSACAPSKRSARSTSAAARAAPPAAPLIDVGFAEVALGSDGRAAEIEALRRHPALEAIVRHKALYGATDLDRGALLEELLSNVPDPAAAWRVLEAWRDRVNELAASVRAAEAYLPPDGAFVGRVFFIVGYERGFASPPDIAINVASPPFPADPAEVAFYVTHEAHHAAVATLAEVLDHGTRRAQLGAARRVTRVAVVEALQRLFGGPRAGVGAFARAGAARRPTVVASGHRLDVRRRVHARAARARFACVGGGLVAARRTVDGPAGRRSARADQPKNDHEDGLHRRWS